MGIMIIEKKEWVANYEQMKSTAEMAELILKREQSIHTAALAEAKLREEKLKKALGIEMECVSNMRAESAKAKVAAKVKLVDARTMMDDAIKRMTEANSKMQAAESIFQRS
ncbi:putative protein crowded nuclei [Helianthus debilis subsp. tardiflorus]